MNKYHYAEEKHESTIYGLATGEEDARHRLAENSLDIIILNEKDFPEELCKDFNWIKKEMTKKGAIKDPSGKTVIVGAVHHTVKHIRNSTASKIAKKFYSLFVRIKSYNL